MFHSSPAGLHAWADFYVIVGTAAASLTGLMFVVITLVAGVRGFTTRQGLATFSTPTVVHFSTVLGIAAVLAVPWPTIACAAAVLVVAGIAGVAYATAIAVKALGSRDGSDYEADWEDRVFYVVLPFVAYGAILLAAIGLLAAIRGALFMLGGASMLLIFMGIHNAWDVVVYVTSRISREREAADRAQPERDPVNEESSDT